MRDSTNNSSVDLPTNKCQKITVKNTSSTASSTRIITIKSSGITIGSLAAGKSGTYDISDYDKVTLTTDGSTAAAGGIVIGCNYQFHD